MATQMTQKKAASPHGSPRHCVPPLMRKLRAHLFPQVSRSSLTSSAARMWTTRSPSFMYTPKAAAPVRA